MDHASEWKLAAAGAAASVIAVGIWPSPVTWVLVGIVGAYVAKLMFWPAR
ncbi:MAG: hypothetical protein RJA59_1828 [Pseudomonadota bacterium]|jgi:hypothetical protein